VPVAHQWQARKPTLAEVKAMIMAAAFPTGKMASFDWVEVM